MYCVSLCHQNHSPDRYEPHRHLSALSPYDHLARFYRFCVTHVKRHIFALKSLVSEDAYTTMYSLLSSEELPDLNNRLAIIRTGGRKANGTCIFFYTVIMN